MKLTESQARRAIRKWLFEYATDSGVSRRHSTDDKIAGKLGDNRENQPSATIPDEIPIIPMSQMSTQLSVEMPPVEDPEFIPGNVSELGKSTDIVSQQVPPEQIEWFYSQVKDAAEEAIERGTKINILDEYEPDRKESNPTIKPAQKASKESTNESWNRWRQMIANSLNEAKPRRNKKDPLNLKNRKLTRQDMRLYRDPADEDYLDVDTSNLSPSRSSGDDISMTGQVIGGEYQPSLEDLEDMGAALDRDIDELPGYDPRRHRTNQEVITQGGGEEAKLRELVNLKIFPNITTMSGMRKMIRNQIDPVVQIWFTANDLSKQMSQFINSSAGQFMFFDALTCSKLFTDDNVLELKGAKKIADALVAIKFTKKPMPAKYKKKLAVSGDFLRAEVQKFATTKDPNTGMTMAELLAEYDELKDSNRETLMSTGLYSAVMSNIVVSPILRRWAKELRDGTIDISSSKNKGQVSWAEAGQWIEDEVKSVWAGMKNGRKGKKVTQAMQGRMEFHDALDAAQEEAEIRAMELEMEGHEVDTGSNEG